MKQLLLGVFLVLGVSIKAQIVNIPDANFKNALLNHDPVIDTNSDGEISFEEAAYFTGIMRVENKDIADLTGIEAFVNLTRLLSGSNKLTSIDVSKNINLNFLRLSNNELTNLDVSKNILLRDLRLYGNQLTSLDVSNNSAITFLWCTKNQLKNLDVSNNIALQKLFCGDNQLTSLDVSNNIALKELTCGDNQLTSLDVSNNIALQKLTCGDNQLISIDVSNNSALKSLGCYNNQLTSLNVSNNIALEILGCFSNQLTSLNVSNNIVLKRLWCYDNQLTSLDVSNGNNSNLIYFNALNNSDLSCITVDNPTQSRDWPKQQDVWKTDDETNITYYTFDWDDHIVFLEDCSTYPNVNIPDANFKNALLNHDPVIDTNNDGEISYAEAEALNQLLDVSAHLISDLTGVEAFENIIELWCNDNNLSDINLKNNTSLRLLDTSNNNLAVLDLSNQQSLVTLNVGGNVLSALGLSSNTTLEKLYCNNNQITDLDLSSNINLTELFAANNQLTDLNLANGNNTNVITLNVINNPALSCIAVDDLDTASAWLKQQEVLHTDNESGVTYYKFDWDDQITFKSQSGIELGNYNGITNSTNTNGQPNAVDLLYSVVISKADQSSNTYTISDVFGGAYIHFYGDAYGYNFDTPAEFTLDYENCEINLQGTISDSWGQTFDLTGELIDSTTFTISWENPWGDKGTTIYMLDNPDNVFIPDINFKNALLNHSPVIDLDDNGAISITEAKAYQGAMEVANKNISLLKGVEAFENIIELKCNNNNISTLNLESNLNLTLLDVSNNNLAVLDLSNQQSLVALNVGGNVLSALGLSSNTTLEKLYCNNNQITTLNLSSNLNLIEFFAANNQLTDLNLANGNNANFVTLNTINNQALSCIAVDDLDTASAWLKQQEVLYTDNESSVTYYKFDWDDQITFKSQSGIELGNYNCITNATNNDGQPNAVNLSYGVVISMADQSSNTYTISDVFGGAYIHFYGDAYGYNSDTPAEFTLDYENCEINLQGTISDSWGQTFDLTGELIDSTTFTISWENPWGDKGTSTYMLHNPNNVFIPDANFKTALLNHSPVIDLDDNGEISLAEAKAYQGTVVIANKEISLLKGIEAFENIIGLDASNNKLSQIDIINNKNLKSLDLSFNKITEIDLTQNIVLETLSVSDNYLTQLLIFDLVELRNLNGSNNLITTCDVSNNHKLSHLNIANNGLTNLEISHLSALTVLDCSKNEIANIDLTNNLNLSEFACAANALLNLDFSQNTALSKIDFSHNQISEITTNTLKQLVLLNCSNNDINTLDVSKNTLLETLLCNSNALQGLDLSNNVNLTHLNSAYNGLSFLDLSNGNNDKIEALNFKFNYALECVNVEDIFISDQWEENDQIWYEDPVSGEKFKYMNWKSATRNFSENCANQMNVVQIPDAKFKSKLLENPLINSDFDNKILYIEAEYFDEYIDVSDMNISNIKGIEAFVRIHGLHANNNNLKNVDLSKNKYLDQIEIKNNELESIILPESKKLFYLDLENNKIPSIDLNTFENLSYLNLSYNQINQLDTSNNLFIRVLGCRNNLLSGLDLSQNQNLVSLKCGNNNLLSLNISNGNNTNLSWLNCSNNPELYCIEVDDTNVVKSWKREYIQEYPGVWEYNYDWDDHIVFSEDCSALSNQDITNTTFTVYPNPANNFITIDSTLDGNYNLVSMLGKTVGKGSLNIGENTVDLSNFKKGVYFLKISSNNNSKTIKIVKQ